MLHLYDKQGYEKTTKLIQHFRAGQGLIYEHMAICHQWCHLFAGTTKSPLKEVNLRLPYLIKGWFRSLRKFMASAQCSLWFDEDMLYKIEKRREGDKILMEDACKSTISDTDCVHLNWVRLYLRVETLADICNTRGTAIHPGVFKANPKSLSF